MGGSLSKTKVEALRKKLEDEREKYECGKRKMKPACMRIMSKILKKWEVEVDCRERKQL